MRVQRLAELRAMIHAVESPAGAAVPCGPVAGPSAPGEGAAGLAACLRPGVIHEWFGLADTAAAGRRAGARWDPPVGALLQVVRSCLEDDPGAGPAHGRLVVWIGRRVWPYPLLAGGGLLIDPPDAGSRLWAIDLAARCPAVGAVVADGSGLDLTATRRLQLAAERGGALVLVARPPRELDRLSAAATRWMVRPATSAPRTARWVVELLRFRGAKPGRWWMVEWPPFGARDRHALALRRTAAAVRDAIPARRTA